MDRFLQLLTDLVPAWIAFLAIAFGYLVYLFKKASREFMNLAERQAEYLKDRVEVVDKATTIFSRTINQQEKEISRLTERLKKFETHVEESRSTSAQLAIQEIKSIGEGIGGIARMQELMIELVSQAKGGELDAARLKLVSELKAEIASTLEEDIPRAIRKRDLALYPIKLSMCESAPTLIQTLKENGFSASIYASPFSPEGIDEEEEDGEAAPQRFLASDLHEAIWLGRRVPSAMAVRAILIAVRHWPFLKYLHISGDLGEDPPDYIHSELYLGGASHTAVRTFKLRPWTKDAFAQLHENMDQAELHAFVRRFYPP